MAKVADEIRNHMAFLCAFLLIKRVWIGPGPREARHEGNPKLRVRIFPTSFHSICFWLRISGAGQNRLFDKNLALHSASNHKINEFDYSQNMMNGFPDIKEICRAMVTVEKTSDLLDTRGKLG